MREDRAEMRGEGRNALGSAGYKSQQRTGRGGRSPLEWRDSVLCSGETASFIVERLAGVRTERQLDSVRGVSVSGNAEQDHRHTD